jgi:hypothetical protein
VKVQVITLLDLPDTNFIPMHKMLKNALGDFRIVQSAFNGRCYDAHGLIDLMNKELKCDDYFITRTSLFRERDIEKHKLRVEKYTKRGFTLISKLLYGTNTIFYNLKSDKNTTRPIDDKKRRYY